MPAAQQQQKHLRVIEHQRMCSSDLSSCYTQAVRHTQCNQSPSTAATIAALRLHRLTHQLIPHHHQLPRLVAMSTTAASSSSNSLSITNEKSRTPYNGYPERFKVPDDKVDWNTPFDGYSPPDFTMEGTLSKSSDPEDPRQIHHLTLRKTYETDGRILIEPGTGRPQNPFGRTGLRGRGKLYNWGPNHAADPLITRSSGSNGKIEVAVIKRGDNNIWALPGGMVDPNEEPIDTAKREFAEEAGNLEQGSARKQQFDTAIEKIWSDCYQDCVYRGYVDESRNTDNSWMETSAYHWHIPSADHPSFNIPLQSGDDAMEVRWLDTSNSEEMSLLHGNHRSMIERALQRLKQK